LIAALLYLAPVATAQVRTAAHPLERITEAIDGRVTVSRSGNVHPLARPEYDRGIAPPDTRMDRMLLVLQPDPLQQSALEALLEDQQTPASPQYHHWLTAEAFGRSFGVAEHDLARIMGWLEGHGFQVEPPAPARRELIFSGTAAQVLSAFHAEVHVYEIRGQRHYANATDPQIPQALVAVVGGVVSLHDFLSRPLHRMAGPEAGLGPDFTSGGSHYLTPADFATIYDVAALYSQSIAGTGQSVAVLGRTDLKLADVRSFRSQFGLPVNDPDLILNGPDPGIVSLDEQSEATLDVEWAGAVANDAVIQFVVSASTNTSDGIALSAEYAVNNQVAPVVSLSFGNCEAVIGATGNQFWNALWQQAASEGITVLVAAGDSGAADCDIPSAAQAMAGAAVNGLCSTPYSTCVGGTQFSDTSNPSSYWSATSDASNLGSALSYIPEAVWNQSGTVPGGTELWAGGGGTSQVYSKPFWQTGPGVPSDGRRDVPDVALNSSTHDGYLIVLNGQLNVVGGTSCSAPAAAGLIALLVQKTAGPQGNVNPRLYTLATQQSSGGASVFHDVHAGNNSVPGLVGLDAGPGYDQASGLGSMDATQLVNHWNDSTIPAPSLQLSANTASLSLIQGAIAHVTLTIGIGGGFDAAVALSLGTSPPGLTARFLASNTIASPGSGSVTLKLTAGSSMPAGIFNLSIIATGGGLSASAPLAMTVLPSCQYSINPTSASEPAGAGTYSVTVTAQTGCPWNATTYAGWMSLVSGTSGAGSGKLGFSVAANNTASQRVGFLTVAGLTLAVTQAATPVVFSSASTLNPTSASVAATGGAASVVVSVNPPNASWTSASDVGWIAITQGTSGTGVGGVTYSVALNATGVARTGALTIAGLVFTVSQAAAVAPACGYMIALGPIGASAQDYGGTVSVTAGSGCQWIASTNAPWLTISSGGSGAGNGIVSYLVAPNPTARSRRAALTVAGSVIDFTEGAASRDGALIPVRKP
jgi:pseudomonalisin